MIKQTFEELSDKESQYGKIVRVSGPIIEVEGLAHAKCYEFVKIGWQNLIGEINRIDWGGGVTVHCFEDTSGLSNGDLVIKSNDPLQVELGPGLLGQVFDYLQRPWSLQDMFIPKKNYLSALDCKREWEFTPNPNLTEGKAVSESDVIGYVYENSLFQKYKILFPPKTQGKIIFTAPQGNYNIKETLVEIENNGRVSQYRMSHLWPLRMVRPVATKIPKTSEPIFTGQRILDVFYPLQTGEKCLIYGQSGTGKTSLLQGISKYSSADITVYVGCGQTGNDFNMFYDEIKGLLATKKGFSAPIIQKTCLVANLAHESLAARELSVILGTTLSEYFRDLGYNVLLAVDSISKWAESLGLSYREGPTGSGFPTYVSSRVSYLYDRVGVAECIGSSYREGSTTLVGTLAPMKVHGNEAAINALFYSTKTIWNLDKKLSQSRSFPAILTTRSCSIEHRETKSYFERIDWEAGYFKKRIHDILNDAEELEEIIQLVGLECLDEEQRLVFKVAKIIREDFIEQDIFSNKDSFSPIYKTIGIMRCIVEFYEQAKLRVTDLGLSVDFIMEKLKPFLKKISKLKLMNHSESSKTFIQVTIKLCEEMHQAFDQIQINNHILNY